MLVSALVGFAAVVLRCKLSRLQIDIRTDWRS